MGKSPGKIRSQPTAAGGKPVGNIELNADQVAVLQRAFENTLVTNMGCEVVPLD